jgi:hypothetical protein
MPCAVATFLYFLCMQGIWQDPITHAEHVNQINGMLSH